ncbi:MAG: T9SS type A sorting domain-containing protein [Daejeonella sp.]
MKHFYTKKSGVSFLLAKNGILKKLSVMTILLLLFFFTAKAQWVPNGAQTILSTGDKVGIGTSNPTGLFQVQDGHVIFSGVGASGTTIPTGSGSRLMWVSTKRAFRAGGVQADEWDDTNIGSYSVAMGFSAKATQDNSIAIGWKTLATGGNSVAIGNYTTASGSAAIALGEGTYATGQESMATGFSTTASGWNSTAMGKYSLASGNISTAIGNDVLAQSYNSMAIGRYNVGGGDLTTWVATDPLFEIGIGTPSVNRANAMTVLKNGNIGIGISSPVTNLQVQNGTVLFQGTTGNTPVSGFGTRLMWIPAKKAFRAGSISSGEWDDINIGQNSIALGDGPKASGYASVALGSGSSASGLASTAMGGGATASGDYSTAMGRVTSATGSRATAMGDGTGASGNYSTAMGQGTSAAGDFSTAMGYHTDADGMYSTAMGHQSLANKNYATALGQSTSATGLASTSMGEGTTASGDNATAMGYVTKAEANKSLAIGQYNLGGGNPTNWVAADPLFEIGNGLSAASKSNAITVLKNGNTGIGINNPAAKLEVAGQIKITGGSPGLGKVLTSGADGLATWELAMGGGSGWALTGNTGTVDGTNFIGTTDNVPFNIKVNSQKAGRIEADPLKANTFYGYQAGNTNTTGHENNATGYQALYSNTVGNYNMANGFAALYRNINGNNNMATGYKALFNNIDGSANIANGNAALYNNISGHNNTAIGSSALFSNISGKNNTAIGYSSMLSNTTGYDNVANGYSALLDNIGGFNNVALGNAALQSNFSGYSNTANGYAALITNTTGSDNSALGNSADVASGDLINATAIGANSKVTASNAIQLGNAAVTQVFAGTGTTATLITGGLKVTGGVPGLGKVLTSDANGTATWQSPAGGGGGSGWGLTGNGGTIDGTNFIGTTDNKPFNIRVNNQKAGRIDVTLANTFYGYQSGNSTTGGSNNTATGKNALSSNEDGNSNTAIGVSSLQFNTTGSNNTAIGQTALFSNINGTNNTGLGYNANVNTGNLMNATAIGSNATVNASNKIRLGDGAVTVIEGQAAYSIPSDGRFKNNISESDVKGLEFIKKLRPVVYNFDSRKFTEYLTSNMPEDRRVQYLAADFGPSTAIRQSGFIAQEVEKAAQETGYNFNGIHKPENSTDNYSLAYGQFVVPLVKAVQEQEQKIELLQKQLDELKQLIKASNTSVTETAQTANVKTGTENRGLVYDDINIYPNPGKGLFTISSTYTSIDVEVYNMAGNRIYTKKNSAQFDLSGYPRGMYLVTISSNGKEITTKKLIIE